MTTSDKRGNLHAGDGKFTGKPQSADTVTLRPAELNVAAALNTASHLAAKATDITRYLEDGSDEALDDAARRLYRLAAEVRQLGAELATARVIRRVKADYPDGETLELANFGSSSDPSFTPTAVRDIDGRVLWNSDDRPMRESAPRWVLDIQEPMRDVNGDYDSTIESVEPDEFRDHHRNAIRLR